MDRNRVLELAREAGAGEPESLYGRTDYVVMTRGDLERFAVLIEREVRGDAEPVAEHDLKDKRCECCGYMTYHREHMGCIKAAYTHPTPAVVRQLVDALRMVLDDPDALDGRPRTYECVQEALAAAKEAGL